MFYASKVPTKIDWFCCVATGLDWWFVSVWCCEVPFSFIYTTKDATNHNLKPWRQDWFDWFAGFRAAGWISAPTKKAVVVFVSWDKQCRHHLLTRLTALWERQWPLTSDTFQYINKTLQCWAPESKTYFVSKQSVIEVTCKCRNFRTFCIFIHALISMLNISTRPEISETRLESRAGPFFSPLRRVFSSS